MALLRKHLSPPSPKGTEHYSMSSVSTMHSLDILAG